MTDDTLWAVALGGLLAVLGGVIGNVVAGYFAMRGVREQGINDRRRLVFDSQRHDLEHRQGVYHALLNALARLNVVGTLAEIESFRQWRGDSDPEAVVVQRFLQLVARAGDLLTGVRELETHFDQVRARVEAAAVISALDLGDTNRLSSGKRSPHLDRTKQAGSRGAMRDPA